MVTWSSSASTFSDVPDRIFEDPRLAELYDPLDPDRSDLDAYAAIVEELGAGSVLDVGCGTGTFACMLAERGLEVVGVDPARASLAIARAKPHAGGVRWIHGNATMLPPLHVDLAVMTGNVAQVFLTEEAFRATLLGIHAALGPAGHLVFETRDPARKAWQQWNRGQSWVRTELPGIGMIETWSDLLDVAGPLVTFRGTYVFRSGETVMTSESTLRFWERNEIEHILTSCGYVLDDVREAPDRPGMEFVFIARRVDLPGRMRRGQ
jgi:SAM-dependent methyltransferase